MRRRFWMLGEAVESCQACRPWATRPTLPSTKSARSLRDGAASGVLRRCADEESAPRLSVVGAPCNTPNGAPTYITVFTNSSTLSVILLGWINSYASKFCRSAISLSNHRKTNKQAAKIELTADILAQRSRNQKRRREPQMHANGRKCRRKLLLPLETSSRTLSQTLSTAVY